MSIIPVSENYRLIKNAEGQNFFVRSVKEGNRCIFGTVVEKTQSYSKGVGENKSKKSKNNNLTRKLSL
ncbi:hypothetical protein RIR_jg23356.t1 [Rhizophagus irregularis DAOM 181602=DAOM 197198]|nr:hypothetical protein RIR_jg23356.t1 [Rhizophagus irregularis DAOM 181602=DAOM 197198]